MHTIKIMFKDETLSLLDKFYTLKFSVRVLEQNTVQEIQTFKNVVVKRIENANKIIDDQGHKVQGQDLAS